MKCPHCGKPLDFYEEVTDYRDDDTIEVEEHYACYECDETYSRNATYKLVKAGELEE